jgi:hypothetical protein
MTKGSRRVLVANSRSAALGHYLKTMDGKSEHDLLSWFAQRHINSEPSSRALVAP